MITWLDEFARFAADTENRMLHAGFDRTLGKGIPASNLGRAYQFMLNFRDALEESMEPVTPIDRHDMFGRRTIRVLGALSTAALPFLKEALDGDTQPRPLAVQVTKDLIDQLMGIEALDQINTWEIIKQFGTVYIDIPEGAFDVQDGTESLRAFFVTDASGMSGVDPVTLDVVPEAPPGTVAALAVIVRKGEAMWNHRVFGFLLDGTGAVARLDAGDEVDGSEFPRKVFARLVKGAILYFKNGERAKHETLPVVDEREMRTRYNLKKQFKVQEQRQLTLFRVTKLYPPGEGVTVRHLGVTGSKKKGWTLGVRYMRKSFKSHRWAKDENGNKYLKPVKVRRHVVGDPNHPWSHRQQQLFELQASRKEKRHARG